jgi:tetratricopeptide (TPR) repeat protein
VILAAAWTLLVATAVSPGANPTAPDPAAAEVAHRVEEMWKHRDDPAVMASAKKILDDALARWPDDYGLLWRAAAWHFWKSDAPGATDAEKAKYGKDGWDLAEKAVARNPNDAAGHFWAAITMGNYSVGAGILRAISQGIEGKFRRHIAEAERLDPRYGKGAIQNAWGGYYLKLPWPKRDVKKASQYFQQALQVNPNNLRTRVMMAELNLHEDRPAEAKRLLEEVLAAKPGKYDAPEEKRAQILAAETMRKVVDAMK